MRRFPLLLVLALALAGCSKPHEPERIFAVSSGDPVLNAAFVKARSEVDSFLKVLDSGEADSYSVKVAIKDHGKIEYFWLTDISFVDDIFTGNIAKAPEVVTNVKMGQKIDVRRDEIADWLYLKNGKMYGNYTIRALLPKLPPDQAAKVRSMLAE